MAVVSKNQIWPMKVKRIIETELFTMLVSYQN